MLRCPNCRCPTSVVKDSRQKKIADNIYRRRECHKCKHHYTTYEYVDAPGVRVVTIDTEYAIFFGKLLDFIKDNHKLIKSI